MQSNYDANGNIQNIYRNGDLESPSGVIKIDELKYSYEQYSNKLLAVEDQQNDPSGFSDGNLYGDDYTYDDDGNMTSDGNKQIYQITYNHLNLPLAINFGNGSYIKYVYDAQGVKVRKLVSAMQADTSQHQTKTLNRRCQKADTM
ncbi:hypothetical protein [Flavobacterium sp.]|uniref:hypothetical protein n=1 Tax=Flavobacterium sp. TaxID=239 RepID=UPI0011F60C60|nr:hypothetical protein [Flavobacterium sp.]RZJ73778.1 MAG: hypothetical protein EOO49_00015 [Flavobacterium sp.]